MKLVKKNIFGVRLLLIVLVGILGVIGCGGKKKKAALWPLALLGGGSGTSNGGDGAGASTVNAGGGSSTTGSGNNTGGGNGGTGNGGNTDGSGNGNDNTTSDGSMVATPIASPTAGHYSTPQTISFSSTASGGIVKCTTNDTDPTNATATWTPRHIWSLAGLTIKCGTFVNGSLVGTIQSFSYSYSPLKSGQTTSYAAGDDGDTQLGVARSYTDNGDGTVTDNATGLLWQRCSLGLSGASCAAGNLLFRDWETAQTACAALNTASKIWRLPSLLELETLTDYGTSDPSINVTNFPATANNIHWSSTPYLLNAESAWIVSFYNGEVDRNLTFNPFIVRCVSGDSQTSFVKFTDNGDGTIKDKQTGLTWQKCSIGQATDASCSGTASTSQWAAALTACSSLNLAGKTWRLPSIKELETLVDRTIIPPSIDIVFFPATYLQAYNYLSYLSSTTYATITSRAQAINFEIGRVHNAVKTEIDQVRCVSGP